MQERRNRNVTIRPISINENGLYRSSDLMRALGDGAAGLASEDLGARWRTEEDIFGLYIVMESRCEGRSRKRVVEEELRCPL
jgi:hypothetical protein